MTHPATIETLIGLRARRTSKGDAYAAEASELYARAAAATATAADFLSQAADFSGFLRTADLENAADYPDPRTPANTAVAELRAIADLIERIGLPEAGLGVGIELNIHNVKAATAEAFAAKVSAALADAEITRRDRYIEVAYNSDAPGVSVEYSLYLTREELDSVLPGGMAINLDPGEFVEDIDAASAEATNGEPLPHDAYMDAVAGALEKHGVKLESWWTETPDGEQLVGVFNFVETRTIREAWADGVYLAWDQRRGWDLITKGVNRSVFTLGCGSARLDTYAHPERVALVARQMLIGAEVSVGDSSWTGAQSVEAAVQAWENDEQDAAPAGESA